MRHDFRSSLRDFNAKLRIFPAIETAGYYRTSLRDYNGLSPTFRDFQLSLGIVNIYCPAYCFLKKNIVYCT
jgi:hypothetical protein